MSRTTSSRSLQNAGRRISIALVLLSAGFATACGVALPPQNATPTERFEWSRDRFERKKYNDAIRGFRDLLFREPLHPTADSARYLLAESYLQTHQNLLAANEFRMLAQSRPNSPVADDAQLGMCRSYWELSPSIPRDQEYTEQTIEACNRLLEYFPRSDLDDEARDLIEKARVKLADKRARVGTWYYERKFYESAIIYFESTVQDYPDAPVIPEVLAKLYDSYSQVGFLTEARGVRKTLLERFPDSPEARTLGPETDADGGSTSE